MVCGFFCAKVQAAKRTEKEWAINTYWTYIGTGIPTREGLHGVVEYLQEGKQTPVVWVNLREEPILYINGRPFVLRRLDHPFANLEHTGISRSRVEDMESRLKADVLEEAAANDSYSILIHEEDETGGMTPRFETVIDVETPMELFLNLGLVYFRIPITDEQGMLLCWAVLPLHVE